MLFGKIDLFLRDVRDKKFAMSVLHHRKLVTSCDIDIGNGHIMSGTMIIPLKMDVNYVSIFFNYHFLKC